MTSKEAYIKKLKGQLDKWNSEIDILKSNAKLVRIDAKQRYEERIKQLHDKCEAAKEKLHKSDNVGWEEFKEGTDEMWNGIKQLFKDTKTEFCKGLEEGKE